MREIRTGSRSADLRRRPSRDCATAACPPTRWPPPSARCGSSWSSRRIPRRSCAARCCRNTIASPRFCAFRDRPDLTPDEQEESLADLQREIAAAWQTDEVRRARVSPLDEVRAGLVVFEQSLWDALPQYLRAVDRALAATAGTHAAARRRAHTIRIVDWRRSRRQSQHHAGSDATSHVARALAGRRSVSQGDHRAAQRAVALGVACERRASRARRQRARAVSRAARRGARSPRRDARSGRRGARGICAEADRHRAVPRGGGTRRTAGAVFPVARVDRQRGDGGGPPHRHPAPRRRRSASRSRGWICGRKPSVTPRPWIGLRRAAGLGRYAALSEPDRQRLLVQHLAAGRRPVRRPAERRPPTNEVRDVLDTFRVAARIHPESLGAYVITMASAPSDVLAVEFLQMAAGTHAPAARRAALRDRARSRACGRHHERPARDSVVPQPDRRAAGSDDRLFRFREGRGAHERRLGALLRAGGGRRGVREEPACG